jgi:hypothetical protein
MTKSVMQARVIYTNHQGERVETTLEVTQSYGSNDVGKPTHFSAFNLSSVGFGKADKDPIGAIHRLMQDHGNVIAIQTIQN